MKKFFVFAAVLSVVFSSSALAQVSESLEWATRIKAEGLSRSKVDEIAQYITDYAGSRLTASIQKRRADSLMIAKLGEFGLSNPRAAFAAEFSRGGWDVVKTYAAMTSPYYCTFAVNPKAWTGSTDGLVKGECMIFDVQEKEDLEKFFTNIRTPIATEFDPQYKIGGGGWGGGSSGNTISNAAQGYAFVTSSINYSTGRYYTLADAQGQNLVTYSFPASCNSSLALFTATGMVKGSSYNIKYGTTEPEDAATVWHGLYLGSSHQGTTSVTSFIAK